MSDSVRDGTSLTLEEGVAADGSLRATADLLDATELELQVMSRNCI